MNDYQKNTVRNPLIVAKAGMWYTVCIFCFKAMAFLTTPFFSRCMTKAELGSFSNFVSIASLFIVLTSFDLSQSIIRFKAENEMDIDCYIWSILSMSTLWTLIIYVAFLAFPTFFAEILKMKQQYIHILFWYLFAAPPYIMLVTKQRVFYQYKKFVLFTGIIAISGTLMAFLLVLLMQDKLTGRIIGFYTPQILMGAVIFGYLAKRGKKAKISYWKYATELCLPMVPHDLSLHILGVSAFIIITRFCGPEYTAFYSIAYGAYHIATILFDTMNKAWSPWLIESLHNKNYEQIKKASRIYIFVFALIITGVLLIVPEIILVLGGSKYAQSVYCLPALLTSCSFLFVFTMYVNIEFYEKKTMGISIATMIGMVVNLTLNVLLIPLNPEKSYIIASYTTLAGYIILFIIHVFIVKKMKMDHVYDIKFIIMILAIIMIFAGGMNILYSYTLVRWSVILLYGSIVLYLIFRFKEQIRSVFLQRD